LLPPQVESVVRHVQALRMLAPRALRLHGSGPRGEALMVQARSVMRIHPEPEADLPLHLAALLVAIGAALSGPIGLTLTLLRPQPAWTDVATFSANAHGIQQVPYWMGFLLLAGCVMFFARLGAMSFERHRTRTLIALLCVGIYGALITLNYALQVAYVPHLARTQDPALAYVTMANAAAPTWVLEMFGYAVLGVATFVVAPMFGFAGKRRSWIRRLFVANGAVSVASAIVTAVDVTWVQTVPGLVAYLAWNGLFIAMMTLVSLEYRPRTV